MNSATSTDAVAAPATAARRTLADRLLLAYPLAAVYLVLSLVYAVESWSRLTPWLFSDELELTQLSRSIADTGRAARRGQAHSPDSLYTVLTAPVWLIQDVGTAYAGVKYLDVFVMASVVFPTYFLARLVVGRRPALFAAAGAGAIPSLAYSSYIVEETLAYPYAALCFFLIAKALVELRRSRRSYAWTAGAVVASLVAPAVRGELVLIPAVFLFAALFAAWSSDRWRERRRGWSLANYVGLAVLVLGAVFLVSGVGSKYSQQWYAVTTYYKHRALDMGGWAAGALAVGIGVVPMMAGLASLVPARGEPRDRGTRAFRSVALAGLIAFVLYTALKAAYLSTVFGTRVEERNLIYVAPLLFVGTALVLARRRVNPVALAVSAMLTCYLVAYAAYHAVGSPYEMGIQLYSDALGFSILQQGNRYLYLSIGWARLLLIGVFLLGLLALRAPVLRPLRGREPLLAGITTVLAVAIVAWNLTGEISAATGTISISRAQAHSLGRPFTWVDDHTGGASTVYLGAGELDQNAEHTLEFWNRSITRVSSIDGSVDGPGPATGPNYAADGVLSWGTVPGTDDFAVEDRPCVNLAGTVEATHRYFAGGRLQTWALVRLTHPTRLLSECTGLYPDGWSGLHDSQYFRFSGARGRWLKVVVSRKEWSGPSDPSPLHLRVGRLLVRNQYPEFGRLLRERDTTIDSGQERVFWVKAPADRFAVQVVVDKKFVPSEVDPAHYSDSRQLGAQVSYTLVKHGPSGKRRTGT